MKYYRLIRLIFLLIFLLFFTMLDSISAFAGRKPLVIHISRDQYHAAHKNWVACQDEKGIMYFGNEFGLLESDGGGEWKLHTLPNTLPVQGVAVASHQTVFTGGYEEIGRWDRDLSGTLQYTSLTKLLNGSQLHKEEIQHVWIADNNVYFQSPNSIFVYNYQSIRRIILGSGCLSVLKFGEGYWMQKHPGKLYRQQDEFLKAVEGSDLFIGSTVRMALPHGSNNYLIGTSTGKFYLYNGVAFTPWSKSLSKEFVGKELICGIYSTQRNTFFLGTKINGIYEISIDGEVLNHYPIQEKWQDNTLVSLYEDRQDNIWASLSKGMIYLHYDNNLSYYIEENHHAGAVYAATYWKNYLLLATSQGVYYAPQSQLKERNFYSSLRQIKGTQGQAWSFTHNNGKLYCAHSSGMVEIHDDLSVKHTYPIAVGVYKIEPISIKGKNLWLLATYNNPIIVDRESNKLYEIKQFNEPISNIELDHLDNIWLETTTRGVYKCRLGDSLNAFVYSTYYGREIYSSLPANIRISKMGKRIIFVGDNRFYAYSETTDKLLLNQQLNSCFNPNKEIMRVEHWHNEEHWAVGRRSVHRFVYDGYKAHILSSHVIQAENSALVTHHESISILNDSSMLICMDAGFILFNTNLQYPSSSELPAPHIEAIEIDATGKAPLYHNPNQMAYIPYNYDHIHVKFSVGNSFATNLQVEYILQNKQLNDKWKLTKNNGEVVYGRLPHGNYLFKIRTTDGMGSYSAETVFSFRILSPWYQATWVYILYIVAGLSLLYLVAYLIRRRYRNTYLQQIHITETLHLKNMIQKLLCEIDEKNAELFVHTSLLVQKNELILRLRNMVKDWYSRSNQQSVLPLYQKINNLLSDNLDENEDWKQFLIKFEQKNGSFFKRLKADFPELTHNDLRLCACLKLNMETKDIASLMNLSVRGVENNRYRLRKKLGLTPSESLNEYFLSFE